MNLFQRFLQAFKAPPEPPPPGPPDPSDVPWDQWNDVVTARSAAGLKPWPKLSDSAYENTVIGVCSTCDINIYGCQGISSGWFPDGTADIRCGEHFSRAERPL